MTHCRVHLSSEDPSLCRRPSLSDAFFPLPVKFTVRWNVRRGVTIKTSNEKGAIESTGTGWERRTRGKTFRQGIKRELAEIREGRPEGNTPGFSTRRTTKHVFYTLVRLECGNATWTSVFGKIGVPGLPLSYRDCCRHPRKRCSASNQSDRRWASNEKAPPCPPLPPIATNLVSSALHTRC